MSDARPGRHALLIGIDRYPNLPARAQLTGCVHDVRLMAQVLEGSFGFPPEGIVRLENARAGRRGILAAMDRLLGRVAAGDLVVVHYSGHGSRIVDREGDGPDGWDETIVPSDSGRPPHPNRDITDDEIYLWLLELSVVTPYVTLIFDSCFSGSIARDPFTAPVRWLPPDPRPAAELPPSPVPSPAARGALAASRRDLGPSGWLPVSDRYALVAACRETEHAFELHGDDGGGPPHGALTRFLCREILDADADSTYRDVFERAAARVTAAFPAQHPQLEGSRDRELFGTRHLPPFPFLPVRERRGCRVALGGGAAHGLTAGSVWAVYPQGSRRPDPGRRQGLVRVREVGAVTAEAEVVEEAPAGAIEPGSRAVEEAHRFGEMRLVVEVRARAAPPEARCALRVALGASELLRPALRGEEGAVRLYAVGPRARLAPAAPAPQLGPLAEATWAVVGTDGGLFVPPVPVAASGAVPSLVEALQKRARSRFLLGLENPSRRSRLKGRIAARLLRRRDGRWDEAAPAAGASEIVYTEGDRIALALTHRHRAPLYLHVLGFGLSGAIDLLYPVAGANEPLAPGTTLEIGVRPGDELEVYLPEGFPFAPGPPAGAEYYKVFATTRETDLTPLLQEGFRTGAKAAEEAAPDPLQQLVRLAATGRGSRDTRPVDLAPGDDWTALTLAFTLTRAGAEEGEATPEG